jgi:hypothetical protein
MWVGDETGHLLMENWAHRGQIRKAYVIEAGPSTIILLTQWINHRLRRDVNVGDATVGMSTP